MKTYYLHASADHIMVNVTGGKDYYLGAVWATDLALLTEPPGLPRTPVNYLESPQKYVHDPPTLANPEAIVVDKGWWKSIRDTHRTVYCQIRWRANPNAAWVVLNTVEFILNHTPLGDAGPDQIIALDQMGKTTADVYLDGTASDDVDLHTPVHPAVGPLGYRWSPIQKPNGIVLAGVTWAAAKALPRTANPLFLATGTAVPQSDRGVYTFKLQVDDNEIATIGPYTGQSATSTVDTRVLLGLPGGADLSLASPSTANPYFGNHEDSVDMAIYYTVKPPITTQPAFQNGWMVRCTIEQALESPVYGFTLVGQKVFEITQVPLPFDVQVIRWDGIDSASPFPGGKAVGAFKIRLELLDADGNMALDANGVPVPGSVIEQDKAIVLDYVRWILPVDIVQSQAAQTGGFMESGHGPPGHLSHIHGGIDVAKRPIPPPLPAPQPEVFAVRSGYYTQLNDNVNTIELEHAAPDKTRYLHSDHRANLGAHTLVVQGTTLARMDKIGTGSVHLHFEHQITLPQLQNVNPLAIISLRDDLSPTIDAVFVREAPVGGAADLTHAMDKIAGLAHLIVRCRDSAHPDAISQVRNGPYKVRVVEQNGIVGWQLVVFDRFTAANQLSDFFATQGTISLNNPLQPVDLLNHYLPYIMWDTTPYQRRGAPLRLTVYVEDFQGKVAKRDLVIGPETAYVSGPPNPATTSAVPAPFDLDIVVTCWTDNLNSANANNTTFYTSDNYHLDLDGAPIGWTVALVGAPAGAETRTGPINNRATKQMTLRIDPHGQAPAGFHTFDIVVFSDILWEVGSRVNVTARVT